MATSNNAEIYLTAEDVMARFSISETTLWRWQKKHDFPDQRMIGRKRYFRRSEINAWDEKQSGKPMHDPEKALGLPIVSPLIQSYDDFVKAMKARREAMSMTSMEAEAKSGLQEGYIPKLENWDKRYGRGVGPETLPLWMGAMRVGMILVDIPRRPRVSKMQEKTSVDDQIELLETMKKALDCGDPVQQLAASAWIHDYYKRRAGLNDHAKV